MTTIFGIIIFCMAMFIVAFYLYEFGRVNAERANEYDRLYCLIKVKIVGPVSQTKYKDIFKLFEELSGLKWKEEERTDVLFREFMTKYKTFAEADEFSPESIFGK